MCSSKAPAAATRCAVFPDAADMPAERMQAHAAELNLSETTFVTRWDESSYDVRIFTPRRRASFRRAPDARDRLGAPRPWMLKGDVFTQNSGGRPHRGMEGR